VGVFPNRQVGVDAGVLGDVPDLVPQHRSAGRLAEHRYPAGLDDLNADDGPDQRGLAAAARSEQPGHAAVRDLGAEAVQHLFLAALHDEVDDVDSGLHAHLLPSSINSSIDELNVR
jgi:hypothetical protein